MTKAIILAGGLGTRLKPFTDFHPKALALVNGKTLLERNIEYLKGFGVDGIIINVHHFAEQIIQFLDAHHSFDIDIQISDESDKALETGGGLLKAKWYFEKEKTPFVLMNADILTQLSLSDMLFIAGLIGGALDFCPPPPPPPPEDFSPLSISYGFSLPIDCLLKTGSGILCPICSWLTS
jgi:choline kinase